MPNPAASSSEVGVLKLLGEHFSHVIPQSPNPSSHPPSLILGRKLSQQPGDVFPIAADRNISRQHARLYWQPHATQSGLGQRWYVECLGKNGMHVDDRFVDGNSRQALDWAGGLFIKMQIGDVVFFVMQPVPTKAEAAEAAQAAMGQQANGQEVR